MAELIVYGCFSGIIALLFFFNHITNAWGSPLVFFPLVWSFYLAFPLLFAPHFYVSPTILVWLFVLVGFWGFGCIVGYAVPLGDAGESRGNKFSQPFVRKDLLNWILFGNLCGLAAIGLTLKNAGTINFTLELMRQVSEISRQNAVERYAGRYNSSSLVNILLSFTYFAAIVGGMLASGLDQRNRNLNIWRLLSCSPVVLIFAFGVIQNTKASLLYALCLWISGYLVCSIHDNKSVVVLASPRKILKFSLSILFIFLIFYWMQKTRYNGIYPLIDAYEGFMVYSAGHLGGFSYWFDNLFRPGSSLGFGVHSFDGFLGPIGISDWKDAPLHIPKHLSGNFYTNVDTAFSELISDFGAIGSQFVVLLFGLFSTVFYRLVKRGYIYALPVLSLFYSVTLWSFTTNLLNYTSIMAAYFLFSIFAVTKGNSRYL